MYDDEVGRLLPQQYPFRFIDKIIDTDHATYITCLKNVTINEYFFSGHFPNNPVLPGAIIIETAAQSVILLYNQKYSKNSEYYNYLLKKCEMEFNKPVVPGDSIIFQAKTIKMVESAGIFEVKCFVKSEIVAKGKIVFAVVER